MIQSHVLQLTSLVAVEPPASFDANSVRNEKLKVLQSIRPFNLEMVAQWVVRGQYAPGKFGDKVLPGYREEHQVSPTSRTETFVAVRVLIDNWRWAGVPFYLRTGKRLAKRTTEIMIQFKRAPHIVFPRKGRETEPAGAEYPAGRRNLRFVRSQEARNGDEHRNSGHEFQLSQSIWRRIAERLRHAFERLLARRRDACLIAGIRSKRHGHWWTRSWMCGAPQRPPRCRSTLLVAGDRRNRTNYSKETADNGITLKTV